MAHPSVPEIDFLDFHTRCSYEYPESSAGACDGQRCTKDATTFDWIEGQPYCSKHWLVMNVQHTIVEELEVGR